MKVMLGSDGVMWVCDVGVVCGDGGGGMMV